MKLSMEKRRSLYDAMLQHSENFAALFRDVVEWVEREFPDEPKSAKGSTSKEKT